MTSGECDIITGYHVEDWEQHIIVLEGLKEGRLKEIWENMPRHNTQGISLCFTHKHTLSSIAHP